MSRISTGAEMPLPSAVVDIARRLEEAGFETWCVGGAVRDWLHGHPDQDVDLATAARPDDVQRLFRRTVPVGIEHGTVGVLDPEGLLHEVTTFRKDVATDGRHAQVEFGVSIEEDLARRDFTINALAYHPFRAELKDPFQGAADLKGRVIRAVGDAPLRFAEDYLRILRMVRFAARFDFTIAPATWEAARRTAAELRHLSAERVREEWYKGLESARSIPRLVTLWREVGATEVWLPELSTSVPAIGSAVARDPVVLTAALSAAPAPLLRRLKASNAEVARAAAMTKGPREPSGLDPRQIRRWRARVGDAADDLMQLARLPADGEPRWVGLVLESRSRGEAVSRGELAITGNDLVQAGVPAGPELGALLEKLLDAVIDDPAQNTPEALLALVRSWR